MATATTPDTGLLDSRDAAKYLGLSQRTLYTLTKPRGEIPVVRPTTWSVRYLRSDLDAYIASKREG